MQINKWCFTILVISLTNVVQAKDKPSEHLDDSIPQVVVTATRHAKEISATGRSMEVITSRQIQQKGARDIGDILDETPGLQIIRNSSRGRVTSIFVRGGESDHTLVMVDGIHVNLDGGQVDLGWLDITDVDRIEIVRGPASALYGADGLAGVIHIITKKGQGPPTLTLQTGGGTFGEFLQTFHVSGSLDDERVGYRFGGLVNGIENADFKNSDFFRQALNGRITLQPIDNTSIDIIAQWKQDDADIYSTGIGPRFTGEDPNDTQDTENLLVGVKWSQIWNEKWETHIHLSRYEQNLAFDTKADEVEDFFGDNLFLSDFVRESVDIQQIYTSPKGYRITLGYERENEDLTQETQPSTPASSFDRDNDGFYLQGEFIPVQAWNLTTAIRHDDSSDFDEETVGSLFTSYHVKETDTLVRGGWSKGIKAPTFVEINGFPSFGVQGLGSQAKPEESKSWEAGVDQWLFDKRLKIGAAYAYTDFEKLVQFGASQFVQTDEAKTETIETVWLWKIHDRLRLFGNLTWLDTEDNQGQDLLRRAEWAYNIALQHRPINTLTLQANVRGVGNRDDLNFQTSERVENDRYHIVDLSASYQIFDTWKAFIQIHNVLDEDYEEVFGFPSDSLSAFVGIEYKHIL
ncbi:MAG: TonB-dependent receptor [Kiritimatiellae bacterium]|nr:TonB-dependent receptor [Kiritimatiellia bacterium]